LPWPRNTLNSAERQHRKRSRPRPFLVSSEWRPRTILALEAQQAADGAVGCTAHLCHECQTREAGGFNYKLRVIAEAPAAVRQLAPPQFHGHVLPAHARLSAAHLGTSTRTNLDHRFGDISVLPISNGFV